MNNLEVLNEQEVLGKHFRVYGTIDEPLFLAKDVAEWIEHTDLSRMVDLVDEGEKLKRTLYVSGQNREVWLLTEDEPHAILGRAITTAKTSILVGDLAKILNQNGVDVGAKRLFEWLRENGYLIKRKGTDWNMPTQRSMDLELFEVKESVRIDGNGCNKITRTTKVTGKGQEYFVNRFLSKGQED